MKQKLFCPYCKTTLMEKFIEGRNRLFCNTCNEPLYENPTPATAVVLINSNEQILLVKRAIEPKKGLWCLPGGFMELNETPEEAALRELKEETGLDGKVKMLLGAKTSHSDRYGTILVMGFLVKTYSGMMEAGPDEEIVGFSDYKGIPLTNIAFPSHLEFINIYYSAFGERT